MITVSKTSFCQNGSQVQVTLSKQEILSTISQYQSSTYRETFDIPTYINELEYLSEDSHGYSILDINNIDNSDLDMI